MKQKLLLLALSFVLFSVTSNSFADKYHGEFCWQVFSESGDPLWRYQLGIYEKEGGHLALYGAVDYGTNGNSASHGNAIFVGNNIKVTLVSADREEGIQVWAETFAATLNSSTLSGTWNALTLEINDGEDTSGSVHQRGTINLIACQ